MTNDCIDRYGAAESNKLCSAVCCYKDILRLQIAMHNTFLMHSHERGLNAY